MNRTDLQQLAEIRIDDAKSLLGAGRWSGAYYLAGYATECALKACIAKSTSAGDFPDKKLADKSCTHAIDKLIEAANLKTKLDRDTAANPNLSANRAIVKDWTEHSRYELKTETKAKDLFNAITDTKDGLLPWIKLHW